MAALQKLSQLSQPHCVLLAVQYATESNILALRALTALRDGDLPLELTLSIILNYLPEESDPSSYHDFLHDWRLGRGILEKPPLHPSTYPRSNNSPIRGRRREGTRCISRL
jgi:hypothetical protein